MSGDGRLLPWLLLIALVGCSERGWHPTRTGTTTPEDSESAFVQAASGREWDFYEALHPGARAEYRRRDLATGGLEAFERQGRDLFFRDAPWDAAQAPKVLPMHTRGAVTSADSTRCAGCHHAGGAAGSGTFADLVLLDGTGDDVLSADRHLPRMLAGAALLERAADGDPERHPFGWRGDRPPPPPRAGRETPIPRRSPAGSSGRTPRRGRTGGWPRPSPPGCWG